MIVRRGYRKPPSYKIDRLPPGPNGLCFDVITNGFGAMPDYAAQIQPADRWAIVAYVRALQLSQNASINDVPAAARARCAMTAAALDFNIPSRPARRAPPVAQPLRPRGRACCSWSPASS